MIEKGERVPFYRDLSESVEMDVNMSDIVVDKPEKEGFYDTHVVKSDVMIKNSNIVNKPPVPTLDVKMEEVKMENHFWGEETDAKIQTPKKGEDNKGPVMHKCKLEINKFDLQNEDKSIFNRISVKTNIFQNLTGESKDKKLKPPSEDSSDWGLSESDIDHMLDPYVHRINKRISCKVCAMKFFNKTKAKSHVENKHVDCFQYKCPFCKSVKNKRLSYQCHIVAKHSAKKGQFIPKIRMRKQFCVTGVEASSAGEASPDAAVAEKSNSNYDLGFVTFLRTVLAASAATPASWHRVLTCAEWIDIEQGIFRINSPDEFTTRWHQFKETNYISWKTLQATVINSFINRNILKIIDQDELVFQVFCIRKLLK